MAMMPINKNPSRRELFVFALLLPVFFGVTGALRWRAGSTALAEALWTAGLVVSLATMASSKARRLVYLGCTYATYPIAWTVSHVALAAMYFLIVTPLALVLRVLGRDPLQRRFDRTAPTYWILRRPSKDTARYFRQF
jgi:hypothetical protein